MSSPVILKKRGGASSMGNEMNGPPLTQFPSSSVQDYLNAMWEIAGADVASTNDVAGRLSIAPALVTNMFARLQDMGLVQYQRYHGASLTAKGQAEALRLVRRHRLIETFLLENLGYAWEEVHEEAERLEHSVSDGFTERLEEFLGYPDRDPHGALIPAADGTLKPDSSRPLKVTETGERVRISRVEHRDAAALSFLGERGLVPGRLLEVREVRTLDGIVTVKDEDGTTRSIGSSLASSIFVQSLSE